MSIAAQNRLRTKRETLYTSAKGGFREDLNCYFRSMWEANFARVLTLQGKSWKYECQTFQLSESFSYTPDFFVEDENVFYEIKGRLDEKSKRQLEIMRERFPDVVVKLIDSEKYSEIRLRFKSQVNWEGK